MKKPGFFSPCSCIKKLFFFITILNYISILRAAWTKKTKLLVSHLHSRQLVHVCFIFHQLDLCYVCPMSSYLTKILQKSEERTIAKRFTVDGSCKDVRNKLLISKWIYYAKAIYKIKPCTNLSKIIFQNFSLPFSSNS